jgi:hypothetical protein
MMGLKPKVKKSVVEFLGKYPDAVVDFRHSNPRWSATHFYELVALQYGLPDPEINTKKCWYTDQRTERKLCLPNTLVRQFAERDDRQRVRDICAEVEALVEAHNSKVKKQP